MDHQTASTPIYTSNNYSSEADFYNLFESNDRDATKDVPSARSPTTVSAVAELNGVFRLPDCALERGIPIDSRQDETGSDASSSSSSSSTIRQQQPQQQQLRLTDGELSTFSEDTEEGSSGEGGSSTGIRRSRFAVQRRRSPHQSIFRPVGGTKRRCDFVDEDDEHSDSENDYNSPAKRRRYSAPTLLRANPIGHGDDNNHDDNCDDNNNFQPGLSLSHSFASPFKRVRSEKNSIGGGATSLAPLFAATDGTANGNPRSLEAAMDAVDRNAMFSVTPLERTRAYPFEAPSMFRRASRIAVGEDKSAFVSF